MNETHVPVIVPAKETVNYTGRHGYTSQNVLTVCDFDMRFTFVVAGWAGSVHDTRIFHHSTEKYASTYPAPPQVITHHYHFNSMSSYYINIITIHLY